MARQVAGVGETYAQRGLPDRGASRRYQALGFLDAAAEMTALTRRLESAGQMPSMSAFDGMVNASVKVKPR